MKFRDIPQFTRQGSYQVDVHLNYFKSAIDRYVEEEGLQLNPDFQRGHVWTEEQQIKYIEYLLRGGKSGNIVYLNNPSWHITQDGWNEFVCVDGLQRLTAIYRFVSDEIKVFDTLYSEFEDSPRMINATIKININDLRTRQEVLQWYLEMNSGGTVHTNDELNRVRDLLIKET